MNDESLLHRQIHPSFIQGGNVTSQAFSPTLKDENKLSCYDGELITATAAYDHYVGTLGMKSVGVVAVSTCECLEQGLPARPDPEPFPEHAVIDFEGNTTGDIRRKAKKLRQKAEERGWLYKP